MVPKPLFSTQLKNELLHVQLKKLGKSPDIKASSKNQDSMDLGLAMENLASNLEKNMNNSNPVENSQTGEEVMFVDATDGALPSH